MGCAIGKGLADDQAGHLGELRLGDGAGGAERTELDLDAKRFDGANRRRHMRPGVPFVERLDRELQQQHAAMVATDDRPRRRPRLPAIDSDRQGGAYLAHPIITQSAHPIDEQGEGEGLGGVKLQNTALSNRIIGWLKHHLGLETTLVSGCIGDHDASKTQDRLISSQYYARASARVRRLTPPQLTPRRCHESPVFMRQRDHETLRLDWRGRRTA